MGIKNNNISTILGATAACVAFVATGGGSGPFSSLISNLSTSIASAGLGDFYYQKLAKIRLANREFDDLNHDLEKAFQRATLKAIVHLELEFLSYYKLQVSKNIFEIRLLKIKLFFKEWREDITIDMPNIIANAEIIKSYIFENSDKGLDYISERYMKTANEKATYFLDFTKLNFFKILDTCFFEELKEDTKSYRAFVVLHLKSTNHIVSTIDSNVRRIQKSIDQIETNTKIGDLREGKLMYDIPRKMVLNKKIKCTVLIAYSEEIIKKSKKYTTNCVFEDLKISKVMQVELVDFNHSKAFEILPINVKEQFLDKKDTTEWNFYLKPLKEGKHILFLKIAAILVISKKEREKQIVMEIKIEVLANSQGNKMDEYFDSNFWVSSDLKVSEYFNSASNIVISHHEPDRQWVEWDNARYDNRRYDERRWKRRNKRGSSSGRSCLGWVIIIIVVMCLIFFLV